jgi:hypothetical protein
MATEEPITLKEVQLRLGVPQHILIHLCEKGVIEPDFAETSGRGKRREFSQRNLFEFAVALGLRRFEIPVATTALVIRLLRSFAKATAKLVPEFDLPASLLGRGIELSLHLYDGDFLVLSAAGSAFRKRLLLGAKLDLSREAGARPRIEKLDEELRDFDAHLEIDLTRIARRISK